MTTNDTDEAATARTLARWREAEQVAAVARRGRLAAETAAQAASDAIDAAAVTADAAKAALASARLAEVSALKTAAAARIVVEVAGIDLASAEAESGLADGAEARARERYRRAAGQVSSDEARARP